MTIRTRATEETRMSTCPAPLHGTVRAYRHHGCRCPETVARMRAIWRRKRAPGLGGPRRRATDVDDIAVERAVAGERLTLTLRERGLAIDRLTRAGLSARQIGLRLGISDRTVVRYRAGQIQAARPMPERTAA